MTPQIHPTVWIFTISLIVALSGCIQISQSDKHTAVPFEAGKKLRLLTYGEPPQMEWQNAELVVADKWGIEYVGLAGCAVTRSFTDSVAEHNKEVEAMIERKFGASWKTTFTKEVQVELANQKVASDLLDSVQLIITKRTQLEKEGNGLHYHFKPISKNQYSVSASGWGQSDGKDAYVSYFRYFVDIERKKVTLTSDSVMKE